MPGDTQDILESLMAEAGLTRAEAELYLAILEKGSAPLSAEGKPLSKLEAWGMVILSGDGKRYIPVHPRLAIANQYRTWRERMVKEINERRMRADKLILKLIPAYEAATEKRLEGRGGEEGQ